ncbi:hypothetical protein COS91_06215 [Candidatus Desantisbacteria bacterium CG07_land_8_20_14_0_80_39_15]|uniref:Uncharacterized protein n=1 Tax=Candidatus Desantisbacteria bacterium CG07_land_8_20_14_0_80_39_15 TaxID=1974549 RepID=A0A2M6ZFF0_9BACT|nr:MAG: hypothetical protein COS91_06215 [Candidatus Desantisbacteria bacterium CG07_land_8_20_14_0_80_39_15]
MNAPVSFIASINSFIFFSKLNISYFRKKAIFNLKKKGSKASLWKKRGVRRDFVLATGESFRPLAFSYRAYSGKKWLIAKFQSEKKFKKKFLTFGKNVL